MPINQRPSQDKGDIKLFLEDTSLLIQDSCLTASNEVHSITWHSCLLGVVQTELLCSRLGMDFTLVITTKIM